MAAALAHELNQPLTAITASANAAKRLVEDGSFELPDEVIGALNETSDQALRAGEIVHRLRDLVSRGGTEQRVEDLSMLVREATELAMATSTGSALKLHFQLDPLAVYVLA